MFMRRLAMVVGAMVLSTSFAWAQDSAALGKVSFNLNAAAAQARPAASARKFIPRVFAGVWTSAGNGFLVGGGASMRPFAEEKHEIQGNVALNRVEGSNGLGVDVDYLYNFVAPSNASVAPFAAAGLNITHFGGGCGDLEAVLGIDLNCGGTDAALQIGGGIKKPLTNGKEAFVEVYFVLNSGNPVIIRGGIGW